MTGDQFVKKMGSMMVAILKGKVKVNEQQLIAAVEKQLAIFKQSVADRQPTFLDGRRENYQAYDSDRAVLDGRVEDMSKLRRKDSAGRIDPSEATENVDAFDE